LSLDRVMRMLPRSRQISAQRRPAPGRLSKSVPPDAAMLARMGALLKPTRRDPRGEAQLELNELHLDREAW
jgi:hypothetical protein